MNNKEALEKLKAYLKCQKRQVKGIHEDCNNKKCDNYVIYKELQVNILKLLNQQYSHLKAIKEL